MDRDNLAHGCATATVDTSVIRNQEDLIAYAKKHRYRIRNLHDGGPVPPAMPQKSSKDKLGYVGDSDRWDAIVGHRGYVAMDGGQLTVSVFYKSAKGVNRAIERLEAIGGRVDQVGDAELSATVPPEQIDEVLKLITVSKVPLRNPGGNPTSLKRRLSEHAQSAESHESAQVVS